MNRTRLKRVCFTLNNYTDEDERRIQEGIELYRFAIYGRETAPTTGTRHLQGARYSSRGRKRPLCCVLSARFARLC